MSVRHFHHASFRFAGAPLGAVIATQESMTMFAAQAPAAGAPSWFAAMTAGLHARIRNRRARMALSDLSDAQLADIGVDRARIESPRPVARAEAALIANLTAMR
jgi:uncharacterized protein YjiS (DUF1127 family)